MRPSYDVPGIGTFREITLWKAIVFGILTLGIYVLVVTYGHTKEMQAAREQPFDSWPVLFWIGVIPFLGFLHFILYAFNWIGFRELLKKQGQDDSDAVGLVALILAIVVPPVGQIIWAVHFNDWLRRSAGAKPTATAPTLAAPA